MTAGIERAALTSMIAPPAAMTGVWINDQTGAIPILELVLWTMPVADQKVAVSVGSAIVLFAAATGGVGFLISLAKYFRS